MTFLHGKDWNTHLQGCVPEGPTRSDLKASSFRCKEAKADARTRTGDPFITSDEPMSASVRSSRLRPLPMRLPPDWSGLEVTGEDNLVDDWLTPATTHTARTGVSTRSPDPSRRLSLGTPTRPGTRRRNRLVGCSLSTSSQADKELDSSNLRRPRRGKIRSPSGLGIQRPGWR